MHACMDFLLSGMFCVDENNRTFNEIEVGYDMISCYVNVDEKAPLI